MIAKRVYSMWLQTDTQTLREPTAPPVNVETFWPIFALVFNEVEHKDHLYPPSDIGLLLPMQHEYNRARQGLRRTSKGE